MQDLINQAEDLYFALRSDADAATRQEIANDLARFEAKLAARIAAGELRKRQAEALLKMARG